MDHPRRTAEKHWIPPFRGMTGTGWQNLALLVVALLYLLLFGLQISWHATCAKLAADFCSFWSAGYIANHSGYARVYDLAEMGRIQRSIFPTTVDPSAFATIPTPFLPIFIAPFQLFALFRPAPGYWVWAALNLAGLLAYLRFFARRATGEPLRGRLLALSMLAWPVFLNIYSGQINVVLAICAAEFLRAAVAGRPFVAGLWLGGMLLKPQFLVLLLLALLLQRSLRALLGFLTAAIVVLGVSAFLLGAHGISELAKLWTLYARGQQETLAVGVMMNWRMVGLHLASLAGPWLGSAVIIAGTGLTVLAFLVIWMRPVATKSPAFAIAILGTLAATALVAWHSHSTSAIMMLGPFIFLSQPQDRLPKNAFAVWCLLPAGLYLAALVFGPLLSTLLPSLASQVPSILFSGIFLGALGMFGLNIYFLAWAVMKTRQPVQLETQASIP